MKKITTLLLCASLMLVLTTLNEAQAGSNRGINNAMDRLSSMAYGDVVDIYDIFARSLTEVELWEDEIQFFVDQLDYDTRVFKQTAPNGTRIFTFMTDTKFGCIAKILPAIAGVRPELYMHIENCTIPRYCRNGMSTSNYILSTIYKADGTKVKAFNSTATWTFQHVDMEMTTATGNQFSDIWLVETLVVNTPGPSMVQYYTVENVGIIGKRTANVSWE